MQTQTHSNSNTTFGQWLKAKRERLDVSRAEVAQRAHCSVSTVKKVETDERRPSRQMAAMLLNALDVPSAEREALLDLARGSDTESLLPKRGEGLGTQSVRLLSTAASFANRLDIPNNLPSQMNSFVGRESWKL